MTRKNDLPRARSLGDDLMNAFHLQNLLTRTLRNALPDTPDFALLEELDALSRTIAASLEHIAWATIESEHTHPEARRDAAGDVEHKP